MRVFNFLSKFAFICNIAFLLFVFFRWLELKKPAAASAGKVIDVPFFTDIIITLGVSAFIINLIMSIFYVLFLVRGKMKSIPVWLPVINFMFLILQIIYCFFY